MRNGTTTLFAALDMLEGRLIGQCMPRHRHQAFIKFLKQIDSETPADVDLHLIVDNDATHKHPKVKAWLERRKRFHLHFIPSSSSWLNLVERWFREITDKRIRRGTFRSVEQRIEAIRAYIDEQVAQVALAGAVFRRRLHPTVVSVGFLGHGRDLGHGLGDDLISSNVIRSRVSNITPSTT